MLITAGNPSNQSACNGKKSVLGNDVQNMVDFITKDSSNYIYQPLCAAPTCTCMIHVGIISFGPILVVLRARYERSWATMMKSDRAIGSKIVTASQQIFFGDTFFTTTSASWQPWSRAARCTFQNEKMCARSMRTRHDPNHSAHAVSWSPDRGRSHSECTL